MFALPDLPYDHAALEPTVSAETMRLHHGKHHAKYFKTTNELAAKAGLHTESLEDLVRAARETGNAKLYNNAAQAWNHTFFWRCMAPDGSEPSAALAAAVERDFGGLDGLKQKFVDTGLGQFGSGWVWLAATGNRLEVISTHDGDNLLHLPELTPLLLCDVWEHAYYVDYRNDREAFLKAWFDTLADWSFAARQLAAAEGEGSSWRHPGPSTETRAA